MNFTIAGYSIAVPLGEGMSMLATSLWLM